MINWASSRITARKVNFWSEGEVAAKEGVVGDDQVVLRDPLAKVVPRGAALQDEHAEVRDEPVGLAPPVVEHGGGANHQARRGIVRGGGVDHGEPSEGLKGLAQAHVVREHAPKAELREVAEEVESLLLVGPQIGRNGRGQRRLGDAAELGQTLAEGAELAGVAELGQGLLPEVAGVDQFDGLRDGAQGLQTEVSHGLVGSLDGGDVQFHPSRCREA